MTTLVPEILVEQLEIIRWSEERLKNGMNRIEVVEILISSNQPIHSRYANYTAPHRQNIVHAILIGQYTFKTPFSRGQLVTNGNMIGYAGDFDFVEGKFYLYPSKKSLEHKTSDIGKENILDYRPMKESDLHA